MSAKDRIIATRDHGKSLEVAALYSIQQNTDDEFDLTDLQIIRKALQGVDLLNPHKPTLKKAIVDALDVGKKVKSDKKKKLAKKHYDICMDRMKGLSQPEVAEKYHVEVRQVQKIENKLMPQLRDRLERSDYSKHILDDIASVNRIKNLK